MPRQLREVVFVDGVRTPFGKAKGQYAETRADDLVIKCIRELMRRNPSLPPERVDEVALAATTQIGSFSRSSHGLAYRSSSTASSSCSSSMAAGPSRISSTRPGST